MLAAVGAAGPTDKTVTSGHYQPGLMTVDTEGMFLMAGQTIVLVPSGHEPMIVYKIERMCQPVKIIPFMAGIAIALLVAMTAGTVIHLGNDAMLFQPHAVMIIRCKIEIFAVAALAVGDILPEISRAMTTGTIVPSGDIAHHTRLFLFGDTRMAGFAVFIGLCMELMGEPGIKTGYPRIGARFIGIGMADRALGVILIMAVVTGFHGRQKIIRGCCAFQRGFVTSRTGGTSILQVKLMGENNAVLLRRRYQKNPAKDQQGDTYDFLHGIPLPDKVNMV